MDGEQDLARLPQPAMSKVAWPTRSVGSAARHHLRAGVCLAISGGAQW
jgi:hypothetical protein